MGGAEGEAGGGTAEEQAQVGASRCGGVGSRGAGGSDPQEVGVMEMVGVGRVMAVAGLPVEARPRCLRVRRMAA